MYKLRRCVKCQKMVHIHFKEHKYWLKNPCEHTKEIWNTPLSENQLREYVR